MAVITANEAPTFDTGGAMITGLASPSRGSADTAAWRVWFHPDRPSPVHALSREEIFIVLEGAVIARFENPRTEDVRHLVESHLMFGRSHSPPEDAHALDVDELVDPAVTLFGIRCRGELLAIGALKRLDAHQAEVKTMHTVEHARGRGIGRAMLDHLLAVARKRGFELVSLETGAVDAFAPAASLYASAGFVPCEPFGEYRRSPKQHLYDDLPDRRSRLSSRDDPIIITVEFRSRGWLGPRSRVPGTV